VRTDVRCAADEVDRVSRQPFTEGMQAMNRSGAPPRDSRRGGLSGRRRWLAAALAAGLWGISGASSATQPLVEVWKSPSCGCCGDWIQHLKASGFQVKVNEVATAVPVRARLGVADRYGSCHTAVVEGYALEGHVPAREIRRLLKDKPAAIGLAVPGMPVGSPGMDGPAYNGRKDPYDVLVIEKSGSAKVFAQYR
jgi:hypothetical protein